MKPFSSRISGLYKLDPKARRAVIEALGVLDHEAVAQLACGGLSIAVADAMSENVVSTHALPLGIATNFRVDGRDVLIPMAVEEPSVVAAASNAARMTRETGGFFGEADAPIMTAQIQLDDVPDVALARARIEADRAFILGAGDASIPSMTARGGGCRDLEVRVLSTELGVIVVHVYVDVGDAMGANLVDTVAEALAPRIAELAGGTIGLRILSNLPCRRLVRVRCVARAEALGGASVADGIVRASRFAELDPYRAVTHNKGFMNGVDAAALALGQDFRAIEAGAHAFAAMPAKGSISRADQAFAYRPLSTWRRVEGGIEGRAELPLAVGTVGGATRVHAGVRAALLLTRAQTSSELAIVIASAGLASNLAALRALAAEGIQHGHMRLHGRKAAHAPVEDRLEPAILEGAAE